MTTPDAPEIGSEFEWMDIPEGPRIKWPKECVWYSGGQDAMLGLWKMLCEQQPGRVLHLPDFFGPDVPTGWKYFNLPFKYYADDPRWAHPDWDTVDMQPGDLIMVINYFGVRDGEACRQWHEENSDIVYIEDHTQDPLCEWALTSTADYICSSVRKTFPVPDGGVVWSPKDLPLPPEPSRKAWSGSGMRLAAMMHKREYLSDGAVDKDKKNMFRDFYEQGEKLIIRDEDFKISPWSYELLKDGHPVEWRERRVHNARLLLDLLKGAENVEPLFSDWPDGHSPFSVELVFSTNAIREHVQTHLIENDIYAPVHWRPGLEPNERTINLSERILTVHIDQRYNDNDINYVAEMILAALESS